MLRRQTEWCKTKEQNDVLQKENNRLRYETLWFRNQQQPGQAAYSSHDMQSSNSKDDVI